MQNTVSLFERFFGAQELTMAHFLVAAGLISLSCGTTTILYDLTMHHFESPSIA